MGFKARDIPCFEAGSPAQIFQLLAEVGNDGPETDAVDPACGSGALPLHAACQQSMRFEPAVRLHTMKRANGDWIVFDPPCQLRPWNAESLKAFAARHFEQSSGCRPRGGRSAPYPTTSASATDSKSPARVLRQIHAKAGCRASAPD